MREENYKYPLDKAVPAMMVGEVAVKYEASQTFTGEVIESWFKDGYKWELIDGVPYLMATPRPRHQEIKDGLTALFRTHLKGKRCRAFSEMGIYLDVDKNETYLTPDLLILCDKNKMGPKGVNGSPDMIIEILSPSNHKHDRVTKRHKYEQAGVKEYWLLDPENSLLEVVLLGEGGMYHSTIYTDDAVVKINVLDDLEINLAELFADSWVD